MPFSPASPLLDIVNENFVFSHLISYTGIDTVTELETTYDVVLTANESNPPTIIIDKNAITGYYYGQFPADIQYMDYDGVYTNVTTFDQIDTSKLSQMIYYKASMLRSKTYNYTATATYSDPVSGLTDVQTQIYQIVLMNDWSSGITSLKHYIGLTK